MYYLTFSEGRFNLKAGVSMVWLRSPYLPLRPGRIEARGSRFFAYLEHVMVF